MPSCSPRRSYWASVMALNRGNLRLVASDGEPPDNGDMEIAERVIRVEEKLSGIDTRLGLVERDLRDLGRKIDSHFLALLGMIIAGAVGLAGLMAKGFHWL